MHGEQVKTVKDLCTILCVTKSSGCKSPVSSSQLCALRFASRKDRTPQAGPLPDLKAVLGHLTHEVDSFDM